MYKIMKYNSKIKNQFTNSYIIVEYIINKNF